MQNLTNILLNNDYHYRVEVFTKQGGAVGFDSGKEQRMTSLSIPSYELTISMRGLRWTDYRDLRDAYENNNSSTFIADLTSRVPDLRPELTGINSSVWAFRDFRFILDSTTRYKGRITLVTSVFFNYPRYKSIFQQSSNYVKSVSNDTRFLLILDEATPHRAHLYYSNNAIFSSIGQSVRHARNKGGLRRMWDLEWYTNESKFLKVFKFYNMNGGIMGEFGIYDYGYNAGVSQPYVYDGYIENQADYIIPSPDIAISNGRFTQDSFKYEKLVDGMYRYKASFLEVRL